MEEDTINDNHCDFYIISEDIKWEEQVIQELQKRKLEVKCLSRKDWEPGKYKLENLTKPIRRCTKVLVGFTSQPVAGNMEFVAATAVQQMLDNNTLNHGKLIPVKITEAAVIPDYLDPITVANGWEVDFYDKILNTLSDKDVDDKMPSTSHHQQPCPDDVIRKYLLSCQQKLCRNANRFTPPIFNDRCQVDIGFMFTVLNLERIKNDDTLPVEMDKVLNIIQSTPACKVLLEGEGGIGKSTLLRYLAYNWATNKSDEIFKGKILFLVNFSDFDKGETMLDVIIKHIDLETFHLKTKLQNDPDLIKSFIMNHDDEIVLLLDGFDELQEGSESPIGFFRGEKMENSKVILTSRSEKIDEFIKESDVHVKVHGFVTDTIGEYIKKYFKYFNKSELGKSLIEELQLEDKCNVRRKHPEAYSMCKNPMLLLSLCTMWEETHHLPDDKADLFRMFFLCILNQFIDKQETKVEKISKFEDTPQKFVNAMVLLGKCMYESLKKNTLSINKRDFEGEEDMVDLALKLGFVYQDKPRFKTDFEKIFSAPHKLIVESLVGFYFYKVCQSEHLENTLEGTETLLKPLDDSEWQKIRECQHLGNAKEFAIGFLGANADKFLNHWITNTVSTYRSLMAYFKFVNEEHMAPVLNALIDHMSKTDLEIRPHLDDICKSLRKCNSYINLDVKVEKKEHFLQVMIKFHNRIQKPGRELKISLMCKIMSSKKKGKMFAHLLIAVPDQRSLLEAISGKFGDDDLKYLVAECQKLNLKYDVEEYYSSKCSKITAPASFLVNLLINAPKLQLLMYSPLRNTGVTNNLIRECSNRGVKLGLRTLDICRNNLEHIDGSSFSSLFINPTLHRLIMKDCNLSGSIMNDMMACCSGRGVNMELKHLNLSFNDFRNTDDFSFLSLLVNFPKLNMLILKDCKISGVTMNAMISECSNRGVKLELKHLDITRNNLSDLDRSLFASLSDIAPKLDMLIMEDCKISGVIMNGMFRECCKRGVKLELKHLNISSNYLRGLDCSSFTSLLDIAPKLNMLIMEDCIREYGSMTDITKCSSRGVNVELDDMLEFASRSAPSRLFST